MNVQVSCICHEFKLLIDINDDNVVPQISLFFEAEVQRHELHSIVQYRLTEIIRNMACPNGAYLHRTPQFPLWLFLNKQFILNSFKFKINISNKIVLHFSSLCVDVYWKRIQMRLSSKDETINKNTLAKSMKMKYLFLFLFQHKNVHEWTYHVTLIY